MKRLLEAKWAKIAKNTAKIAIFVQLHSRYSFILLQKIPNVFPLVLPSQCLIEVFDLVGKQSEIRLKNLSSTIEN